MDMEQHAAKSPVLMGDGRLSGLFMTAERMLLHAGECTKPRQTTQPCQAGRWT